MALTAAEVDKLFALLRELHGKDKRGDRMAAAIWGAVLEPWDYGQVRMAAVERARHSRYYPDPGELAEYLPKVPRKTAAGATRPQVTGVSELQAKEGQEAAFDRWQSERARLAESRRCAQVPETLAEALESGMTALSWWNALEELGLHCNEARVYGKEAWG